MNTLIPWRFPLQFFCLLLFLFLARPLHAEPGLEPQLAALLRAQGLQGAVWSTLDAQGAAGLSDARSGRAMRADQRVHVGSIAKTLLAAGILRLVSERHLSLDTPVAALLPGIAFINRWEAGDPVRVRHLLDHTAGLDDARLWQVFSMQAKPGAPLAATFPAGRELLRVRARPGSRFSYSNMSYTLLGMVVEAVSKQAYERYLEKELLTPLGMRDSSFAFVSQAHDPRLAMGHVEHGVALPAVPSHVRPAGQFTTTAADMARFAAFLMSDGSLGGKPFIEAPLLRQMGEPAGTEAALAGLRVGYGLGLRRLDRHGAVAKCHGGNTVGFRAMLCLLPERRQAFFIAINTDSETADYQAFDAVLIRALDAARPVPRIQAPLPQPAHAAPSIDIESWAGFYIPSPNRFDSLRYVDTLFNFMRVSTEGNALRLHPFQSGTLELTQAGGPLFRAPGKELASHAALVSSDGARIVSNGTQSHEQVSLVYLLALWSSLGAGLLGLVYIAAKGAARLLGRRMRFHDPLLAPCAGVLALLLPLPLFYSQSFLQLGDLTPASGLLAAVTGALPLTMLAGLGMALSRGSMRSAEAVAMLAVLQWSLVLACWGLLPLRLWS